MYLKTSNYDYDKTCSELLSEFIFSLKCTLKF